MKNNFKNKYKLDKYKFGVHKLVITYILEKIQQNAKILDVGCASGYLGEILSKKGYIVYGIDIDRDAVNLAKSKGYTDVANIDLDRFDKLPWPYEFFDVILVLDVLEHLKYPDKALLVLKKYLKKGGLLIVSLPNIVYWKIRLKILLGNFEYEESGILDKTHLRFYTLKTSKRLLQQAGFKIIDVKYTGFLVNKPLFKLFPSLFAYQIIYFTSI